MNRSRVEAFSDGVFAIAITLLVLTISEPTSFLNLGTQLAHRWPSFFAYAVSFAIIGIMWINHHAVLENVRQIDRKFVYLNFLLLMTIAFLPYTTGVLGGALASGESTRTAAVFYSSVMAINAYAWVALWLYASVGRRLLDQKLPESLRSIVTKLFGVGVILYTIAVGVAFLNAYVALALQALFAIYYGLDPISRRVARASAQVQVNRADNA